MLGSGLDSEAIGDLIVTSLQTAGYTASRTLNRITYTRGTTGPSTAISFTVTNGGKSTIQAADFTVSHTSGNVQVSTGTNGTATLTIDGTDETISIAGLNAEQMTDAFRTAINNGSVFQASEPSPTSLLAQSIEQRNANISITINRTGDPDGTAAVSRTVVQTGQAPSIHYSRYPAA